MDASTILILGAIILGLGSFCLLVVRLTNNKLNGLGWLGAAFASGGVGAVLYLLGALPRLLTVVCGDVCVLASIYLLHVAVLELLEGRKRFPRTGLVLLCVMAVVDVLNITRHTTGRVRIFTISILAAIQATHTAVVLWKAARQKIRNPALFLSGLLLFFAVFNAVRAAGTISGLVHEMRLDAVVQIAAFALYIATAIGIAFGFFWLTTMNFSLQLEDAAGTDPLTRLYNRRTFLKACEKEMEYSKRANRTFAILMLDLDHFKQINDRYGHPVGDMALLATVRCMQDSVRGIDTIGRWGGEEFAVLLPNCNREQAFTQAEKIRLNIENLALVLPKRLSPGVPTLKLTASLGVAICQPTDTIHSLISRADQAMYMAKDAGRNRALTAGS